MAGKHNKTKIVSLIASVFYPLIPKFIRIEDVWKAPYESALHIIIPSKVARFFGSPGAQYDVCTKYLDASFSVLPENDVVVRIKLNNSRKVISLFYEPQEFFSRTPGVLYMTIEDILSLSKPIDDKLDVGFQVDNIGKYSSNLLDKDTIDLIDDDFRIVFPVFSDSMICVHGEEKAALVTPNQIIIGKNMHKILLEPMWFLDKITPTSLEKFALGAELIKLWDSMNSVEIFNSILGLFLMTNKRYGVPVNDVNVVRKVLSNLTSNKDLIEPKDVRTDMMSISNFFYGQVAVVTRGVLSNIKGPFNGMYFNEGDFVIYRRSA